MVNQIVFTFGFAQKNSVRPNSYSVNGWIIIIIIIIIVITLGEF